MYKMESDATAFLRQLVKDRPELQERRLKNRGILWDVKLDREAQDGFKKGRVARTLYPYQSL